MYTDVECVSNETTSPDSGIPNKDYASFCEDITHEHKFFWFAFTGELPKFDVITYDFSKSLTGARKRLLFQRETF